MEYLKRFFRLWPALAFALLVAHVVVAQDGAGDATGIQRALEHNAGLILAAVTPLVVAFFKRYLPTEVLPFLAPMIGAVGSLVLTWLSGITVDPELGVLAGSAGVGVREAVDQGKKALGVRQG